MSNATRQQDKVRNAGAERPLPEERFMNEPRTGATRIGNCGRPDGASSRQLSEKPAEED